MPATRWSVWSGPLRRPRRSRPWAWSRSWAVSATSTCFGAAAGDADGIVHTAFGLDLSRIVELSREETAALEAFGEVYAGSARPIIVTGGVLVMQPGETFMEDARPPVDDRFPRASEQTAFSLADRGVHASVVRNPRSVHAKGETHGFVPMLAKVAREKGFSAYVGDGRNLWPAVHRDDSALVYRLALERGAQGEAYHAIAEEGVPFKAIAEAVGRQLGLPSRSLTPEEAEGHFGGLAMFVAGNGPASNRWTREDPRLGTARDRHSRRHRAP